MLTEVYLCGVCACQEMLRRNGRGQPGAVLPPEQPKTAARDPLARSETGFVDGSAEGLVEMELVLKQRLSELAYVLAEGQWFIAEVPHAPRFTLFALFIWASVRARAMMSGRSWRGGRCVCLCVAGAAHAEAGELGRRGTRQPRQAADDAAGTGGRGAADAR
eukprot:COSAG01_NODE_251_length_20305_cov_5.846447_20_plen_162_part_00